MLEQDIQAKLQEAVNLAVSGQIPVAIEIANGLVSEYPQNFNALMVLGVCHARAQSYSRALPILLALYERQPKNVPVLHYLAISYWQLQNPGLGLRFIQEAIREEPKSAELFFTLGSIQISLQDAVAAEKASRDCLRLAPDYIRAYQVLGQALHRQGKDDEAIECYTKVLEHKIDETTTQILLAAIYKRKGEHEKVEELLSSARASVPFSDDLLMAYANNLYRNRFVTEAKQVYEEIYARHPESAMATRHVAASCRAEGEFERCVELSRKAIDLDPNSPRAYYEYIYAKKADTNDYWVLNQLLKLAKQEWTNFHDQSLVYYSLGKYYSDLHDYEHAAESYNLANEAMLKTLGRNAFDLATYRQRNDFAVNTFTPEFIREHRHLGSTSKRPIFIVGMIRSGTTLVEQIISSHSQVAAGGELDFLIFNTPNAFYSNGSLNVGGFKHMQDNYLNLLESIDPQKPYVTDKMPTNSTLLGLIYLLYPNAKVIHTVRDPGDVCLSVYTTPYFNAVPYAHHRQTVIGVYKEYRRLMDHWRKILPKNFIFDVHYEDLIANQELVTKNIIRHCELDWEDGCLNYTSQGKAILTPSTWQARQPIYTSSIGRWRHYARWYPEFARISEEA